MPLIILLYLCVVTVSVQESPKQATEATKATNAKLLQQQPFSNMKSFEDAKKGFIAPLPLSTSYTITGLTPGINFLKITAFDNSGIESDFSNVVSVVIALVCGDSILSPEEECDDGNASPTDGCDSMCMVENGWVCEIPGAPCRQITCGDGLVEGEEECDDGNLEDGDGCSSACLVEEPPPTVTAIPTLSHWGLITMAGVLGFVGFMVMRRRKVTA